MSSYDRLERSEHAPKRVVDHGPKWAALEPVGSVNGQVEERLARFCESKRISLAALEALGARIAVRRGNKVELAFAGENGSGAVTAIKYRPLDGSSHETTAELPSCWLQPIIVGRRDSLDWLVVEGETDAARVWELAGDRAAVLVLPAGARTFKREWAALIPRGARVGLCHDADEDGDAGAEKAAKIIGGKTKRIRPPVEGGGWCDWAGDREEFLALARSSEEPRFKFSKLDAFLEYAFTEAEPLLGKRGEIFLALGSFLMVYGSDGSGKSTWMLDGLAHLAVGIDWLGIAVPRPVRICIIENEGPPNLFQQKLAAKVATWDGPDFAPNVFVFTGPWGEFSFADAEAREALVAFCEEHAIDLVTANPTLGLGVAASGRPDETQQFVDWLTECGLKSERAFMLAHHENKAGQISGDWGRHPDTKVQLEQDGNRPRTKLTWAKTRWATLPSETVARACLLEWIIETQGYSVTDLETVGASDTELEGRIVEYLLENPMATTRAVMGVKGTNSRIRVLLDGERFDCVEGKNRSLLWFVRSGGGESENEAPTHMGANPDE